MREKQPWLTPDGKWARNYILIGNGHGVIQVIADGDFAGGKVCECRTPLRAISRPVFPANRWLFLQLARFHSGIAITPSECQGSYGSYFPEGLTTTIMNVPGLGRGRVCPSAGGSISSGG